MSNPKNQEQIERIMYLRDVECRLFPYIAREIGIAPKNVTKIYHREKALRSIKKGKNE